MSDWQYRVACLDYVKMQRVSLSKHFLNVKITLTNLKN